MRLLKKFTILKSMDGFIGKIQPGKLSFFNKQGCPFCVKAQNKLDDLKIPYDLVDCPGNPNYSDDIKKQLEQISGMKTYPKIFVGKKIIGGCSEMMSAISSGSFFKDLDTEGISYVK